MTFRLRALALIMFVATMASGVTAWLTLRQASRQLQASAAADRADVRRIHDELHEYGMTRGTWDGVAETVRGLSAATGERIRLVTAAGAVVADSDELAGRAPRPVPAAAFPVDARPGLRLPSDADPTLLVRYTLLALSRYRERAAYAGCLTRARVPVIAPPDDLGVPTVAPAPGAAAGRCRPVPPTPEQMRNDAAEARTCLPGATSAVRDCLVRVFARAALAVAPPRLDVYVGALGDAPAPLAAGPAVVAALAVAAAAVSAALLLSRRVLRPVRDMTVAAHALGAGDLSRRVPARGHDEFADLGRSFNRMADSLEASELRQRQLVADVAHELRTPLANLRGYVEALRDAVVSRTPELVESLHEEVLQQQRIVDDLQDLALAEAGQLRYQFDEVDLADVATATVAGHGGLAGTTGVRLVVAAAPAVVTGDAGRLRQLLANLVTNAVRATPEGGSVTVTVTAADGAAVMEVTDTGTGIAAADLPHVFDRFWRADAARGRATGGSGLGLAIAAQIARDHGGDIDVRSRVGAGTTFVVRLPSAG